jgi:putative DNA primase/helicase
MKKSSLDLGRIPPELKARPQWVVWRIENRDGKPTKVPYTPATPGKKAKADDPGTWSTFEKAQGAAQTNGFSGVGYEFSFYDPYCGIDLDKCRNPETGEIESWAKGIIRRLNSYTEISPSGRGVHVLVKGKLPPGGSRRKGQVEMYDFGRYFTMTGLHLEGTPTSIEDRQTELTALHTETFRQEKKEAPKDSGPSPSIDLADSELLDRAHGAANGEKFGKLWRGDWSEYPSQSEADLALCSMLAFWTGPDPTRIDRLLRQSGLYRKDKWSRPTAGSTYGAKTIEKALTQPKEFYTPGKRPPEPDPSRSQGKGRKKQAPITTGFNLTDLGNAQRLVARHGPDLRFCYPWGKWLVWDGARWIKDESGEVDRRAKDTVRSIYAEAAACEKKELREALADHARRSESDSKRQAMINSARSEPGVALLPADLDRDPWLLNVVNGCIDLRTGELREHRRGDLITKMAPVKYDREAQCPAWWGFLEKIMNGNGPTMEFLQKAVGYALTGDTREHCLFFLYGLGANGKSTCLEVIQALLGDYATQTTSETFLLKRHSSPISNDVADLRGARFVAAVEIESGRRMAEVLIKQMTGGDKLKARFLYSEHFEFKPEFKIFLAANHKPVIRGTDHAIWRRIRLIPFTVQIPEKEQDKELPGKLKAELPGILNWAIEGCLSWQFEGLTPPQAVQDATQNYRQEMDILAEFLSERCIIAPGASVPAADLYKAYTAWAEENGEKKPLSQRDFGLNLTERGFEGKRGTGGRTVRHGIGLRAE